MEWQLLTLSQKETWNRLVENCIFHDFYHTAAYHALACEGTPYLFFYGDTYRYIVFPFLLRPIAGTSYFDITSVYGYAGPLFSHSEPDEAVMNGFSNALHDWMATHHVVAAFARLHPFIPAQKHLLNRLGRVVAMGQTVWIDLADRYRAGYSRSLRHQLNMLNRRMNVREASSPGDWTLFAGIYHAAMNRLHAAPHYYFSPSYFALFRETSDFVSRLYLVDDCEKGVIGGVICTVCQGVAQYHLGACRSDALSLSPLKVLLDFVNGQLQTENVQIFHLGGGYGGMSDTLFQFKSRFSTLYRPFNVWKCIVNQAVYEQLVASVLQQHNCSDLCYFPLYRAF